MAEGGKDIELENIGYDEDEDEDYEIESESFHDNKSFLEDEDYKKESESNHVNKSFLEDEDEDYNEEELNKMNNLLSEEAKILIKKIYDEIDFNKVKVNKNSRGLILIKLDRENGVWFIVNENGIQERKGKIIPKTLLKALGDTNEERLRKIKEKKRKLQMEKEEIESSIESIELERSRESEELKKLKNENFDLKRKENEYLVENEKFKKLLRQTEQELKDYNEEIISLRIRIRNNPTLNIQEQLDNLERLVKEKQEYLLYTEKEIKTKKELHDNLIDEIERNEIERNKQNSTSRMNRELELDFALEEKRNQLEEITQELETLREEREVIVKKLTWREKIKEIFKEHGFSITAILLSIGTIIGTIVSSLTSGVSNVLKMTADGFKALGKKLAQILPGMVGAIASFIFNTAASALGFLAKNSWLLILFVVTIVIEKFISKKK